MPKCPNGHQNPRHQQLCAECDAIIIPAAKRPFSDRALRIIVSASAVVVLAAVLVAVTHRAEPGPSSAPPSTGNAAIQQWWSGAHKHFDGLQGAVKASREALEHRDEPELGPSCQTMHDAAAVELRADLPSPDPDLTAELDAAINDAHDAAHMCLSAVSGSLNNYAGEFVSNLDQAERHLEAALDIVTRSLLEA